jgi:hypothetical protein
LEQVGGCFRRAYATGAAFHATLQTGAGARPAGGRGEEKRAELTVLPDLLDGLDLEGCLASLDALACRPEIAGRIVGRGGDYLLTLRDNRRRVHAEVNG